jgi:hypothetical protein
LALLVAGEPAQNHALHNDPDESNADPPYEGRQPEMQLELQQSVTEIGAEHEKRAVRQIRYSHQAENQREARRQQKQQAAERHAVERLDDPELHFRLPLRRAQRGL